MGNAYYNHPSTPRVETERMPTSVDTTGLPIASASVKTMGPLSEIELTTTISTAANAAAR